MSEETANKEIIKGLLPEHYYCEETKGGINCKSNIGMDDNLYTAFIDCIKEIFKGEFKEVFHQVCTEHLQFTVFLKS